MSKIFFNGSIIDADASLISHKDCGFTTGIGVFDSMLSIDGELQNGKEHFARLNHDANIVIGLSPTLNFEEFKEICKTLMQENKCDKGFARIRSTVTGGIVNNPLGKAESPTILIDVTPCPAPNTNPITVAVIEDFPRVSGCVFENCKRLDYSRSYAARRKAESLGAQEALLTNTDGNIACGATSNIFIEENGILITPPLSDGVLAGVTRLKLIQEGSVKEESISIERLRAAGKAFLTNSFFGLRL
ncbi:MAG: aminotransferase class IV, partial [Pseudomonadota bacterium]